MPQQNNWKMRLMVKTVDEEERSCPVVILFT